MDSRSLLCEDGRAVLALCSQLGAGSADSDAPAPFVLSEWNDLARRLQASPWKRPAGLVGRSAPEISSTLNVVLALAERIAGRLDLGGCLALELERLLAAGVWAVTRADAAYPASLRATLRHQAPPVLFGAGAIELLARRGTAIVGSREIDAEGAEFARRLGVACARSRVPVVSGGARGTDRLAMQAALEEGGTAFGALADSVERTVRQADVREYLLEERLTLVTPYSPTAGFSVGAAMGRNKVIYGLADRAVVIASDWEKGGTWAGAIEALKAGWVPVFVRDGAGGSPGNRELLRRGARSLAEPSLPDIRDLGQTPAKPAEPRVIELDLFDP